MNEPSASAGTEPLIAQVAQLAMRLSRPHLADYGAVRSRHDFTQRQLMSCLILRGYPDVARKFEANFSLHKSHSTVYQR